MAPDRKTQKMPLRTRRSFTRGTSRGLFGSIGLMAVAGAYTSASETQNLTEEGASAEPLSIGRHRQNVAICRNESGVGTGPILTSVGVLGGRLCAGATDTTGRTAAGHPLRSRLVPWADAMHYRHLRHRHWGWSAVTFPRSVLGCLLVVLYVGAALAGEQRIALVVGVSNYKHAPLLANTLNDARGMAEALKRVGFEVEQLLDPDRNALEAGVRNLRQRAHGADTSLFYYAGHAVELGGRNWLLPAPANIQSDRDLRFEALDLDSILEQVEGASRVALIFLDSCRDNPFRMKLATGTREAPMRGLARVASGAGTFVAFSTAPGTVALDGSGTNSPFTAALLKRMETAGLELRRLLSLVRTDVKDATQGRQVPWENSALEGDFFFRPPPAVEVTQPLPQIDRETLFWSSISTSRDPADFRAYLAQFPQGVFVGLARNRLSQLQNALAPPAAPAPAPAIAPQAAASSSSLPQGAPSSPLRDSLIAQLAVVAPEQSQKGREDTARGYERLGGRKAIAALVGTARTWRGGGYKSTERAEEAALESCQFQHGAPCAIVAVDDKVLTPSDQWPRRDMARVRYEGHFDPSRIPSLREDTVNRTDVQGYRVAPSPKAAAFHPWGRLFVVAGASTQAAAEEQALATCNADPTRKGDDGPCYLYAVGNKVVLTKRFSKPRRPATTLEEGFALAFRDRNGFQNYNAESNNKAQAVELESGRSFRWNQHPTKEGAERAALEGCQLRFGQPCILLASNDELKAPDPFQASRQDMPRLRYAGKFRLDMVPLAWSEKAQDLLKSYASTKKHRAIAIRPSPLWLQVYSGAKSEAEAERQVLERCNASGQSAYPCFLYAVDDLVVLPKRRTEPRL